MRLVDLSHTIEHGMITYKGLPAPLMCDFLSREASRKNYSCGHEFQIGKLEMVGNTGTYLDSPFHRYADGKDLSELELGQLAHLDSVVVRAPHARGITVDADAFANVDVTGKAVLVHTGWDAHWRTDPYFEKSPLPHRGGGAAARRARREARRHRLSQHRRYAHARPSGAHSVARRGNPDLRAHVQSRRRARHGVQILRRAPEDEKIRHVPRARLRPRGVSSPNKHCSQL